MSQIEEILKQAREATGLTDYGDNDFLEPMALLLDTVEREARLNDIGRYQFGTMIGTALEWRLKITDFIKQHPDVLEQEVPRPIFVAGLPRTGTTALMHMLNQDDSNHTLRLWEGRSPLPPPEDSTYSSDPRIAQLREEVALAEQFMPGFAKTHVLEADGPDECYMLLNRNFMSVEFTALFHLPTYSNWLYDQDHTKTYAFHKTQLQLLQYRKSGSWVLKSPFHQVGLEAILTIYPDALIVMTHREPMSIVGSGCSFSEVLRKPTTDSMDLHEVGADWMDMLKAYVKRAGTERARLEPKYPGQFLDILYADFMDDPLPQIERIYSASQRDFSDDARGKMQAWLQQNPAGKHGKHEYKLEKYGISRSDVEAVFGDYIQQHGIGMG